MGCCYHLNGGSLPHTLSLFVPIIHTGNVEWSKWVFLFTFGAYGILTNLNCITVQSPKAIVGTKISSDDL